MIYVRRSYVKLVILIIPKEIQMWVPLLLVRKKNGVARQACDTQVTYYVLKIYFFELLLEVLDYLNVPTYDFQVQILILETHIYISSLPTLLYIRSIYNYSSQFYC